MGKKAGKKKVDPEKKAALQAKKEAKAQKSLQKRLQKETRGDDDDQEEETLDAILLEHKQQQELSVATAKLDVIDDFPAARANATLTLVPAESKKVKDAFYLFGGEYYNGVENVVLDHLYRCELSSSGCTWKRIITPTPRPSPRCAHGAAYYNGGLYVFGGEILRSDGITYHHYKDLWRLDIATLTWRELKAPTKVKQLSGNSSSLYPSPRSGAVVSVYKSFLIVFGGFYETASREVAVWYNDVYIMNLQTEEWIDIPHSKWTARPEPRSACQAGVMQISNNGQMKDVLLIHGGFSKLPKSAVKSGANASDDVAGGGGFASGGGSRGATAIAETRVHTDSWILHLDPLQAGKPPTWERWTSSIKSSALQSQTGPVGRAAMGSATYKNRLLVLGGVMDKEQFHHKVESVFFNTLHAMDIDRRKWFPMSITPKKSNAQVPVEESTAIETVPSQIATDDKGSEEEAMDDLENVESELDHETQAGWDLEKLRSSMFAFIDGNGNVVYEKLDGAGEDAKAGSDEEEEKEEEKEGDSDDTEEEEEEKEETKEVEKSRPAQKSIQDMTESAKIAASSVMVLNPETKLPEAVIRQDPLPRIKPLLIVHGHVLYVYGGLLEVGDREVTLDDMWSLDLRKRSWNCLWAGTMHKQVWLGATHDDDDSYYSTEKTVEDDEDDDELDDDDLDDVEQAPSNQAKSAEQEMAALEEQYGLTDPNRVPQPEEALADFFTRTSEYWKNEAAKSATDQLSSKELKRQGFSLAKEHYTTLEPVIARLQELGLAIRKARRKEKKQKKDLK